MNGSPIRDFAQARSAILLSGITASTIRRSANELTLTLAQEPNRSVHSGCATAIAPDGYYLTAAHCLHESINYLVYSDGEVAKAVVPRVVARIFDPSNRLDFAILHVDHGQRRFFSWAPAEKCAPRTPLIALGSSFVAVISSNRAWLRPICVAGQVVSACKTSNNAAIIVSDLFTRKGDSGGPVFKVNGELVGVHLGVLTSRWGPQRAMAARPDLEWIERVVAEDRRTLHGLATELLIEAQVAPEAPTITVSFE